MSIVTLLKLLDGLLERDSRSIEGDTD